LGRKHIHLKQLDAQEEEAAEASWSALLRASWHPLPPNLVIMEGDSKLINELSVKHNSLRLQAKA
jgi:hypothetical protein